MINLSVKKVCHFSIICCIFANENDNTAMNIIRDKQFGGERPLFAIHDTRLENVTITEGESGIKCCTNIEADGCRFIGKYPWWHVDGSLITNCYFEVGSRSAIWYSNDMVMQDTIIDAPKLFREMNNVTVENVTFNDADETFWKVKNLKSDSKYVFQYCKNVEVHNAKITTKDSFWEVENVTIYDSELNGEYLAWHSKNVRLVRCHITGEQPLCYAEQLVLEGCTFGADSDRIFEDSDVCATIIGSITEIKNPRTGSIVADHIGRVIIDENIKQPADCKITERQTL